MCDMTDLCLARKSWMAVWRENRVWLDISCRHYLSWFICDMAHSYVRHDSFVCATWLIYMCDMTHLYVRHDSFICATCLIRLRDISLHMCDMTHSHASLVRVTCFIHTCAMTHQYAWQDRSMRMTWLIRTCDMTHSTGQQVTNWNMTWLIHMCGMSHAYMWYAPCIHVTRPIHTCDMPHPHMCDVPHPHMCDTPHPRVCNDSYVRHDSYVWHDSFHRPTSDELESWKASEKERAIKRHILTRSPFAPLKIEFYFACMFVSFSNILYVSLLVSFPCIVCLFARMF